MIHHLVLSTRLDRSCTAFVCPFPGCGRRFNVNSNMRRHLRNHTSGRGSGAPPYTHPLTTAPRTFYPTSSGTTSPAPYTTSESDDDMSVDELEEPQSYARQRAYTTSHLPSTMVHSAFSSRAPQSLRPRAASCASPRCGCSHPAALHPSSFGIHKR